MVSRISFDDSQINSVLASQTPQRAQQLTVSQATSRAKSVQTTGFGGNLSQQRTFLTQALTGVQNNRRLLGTARSGLKGINTTLQQMKDLLTRAQGNPSTRLQSKQLSNQFKQLSDQIKNLASQTAHSGQSLLDGSVNYSTQTPNPIPDDNYGVVNNIGNTNLSYNAGNVSTGGNVIIGNGNIVANNGGIVNVVGSTPLSPAPVPPPVSSPAPAPAPVGSTNPYFDFLKKEAALITPPVSSPAPAPAPYSPPVSSPAPAPAPVGSTNPYFDFLKKEAALVTPPVSSPAPTPPTTTGSQNLALTDVLKGNTNTYFSPGQQVIQDQQSFDKLLSQIAGPNGNAPNVPAIDFSKQSVIAVFAGQNGDAQINSATLNGNQLTVDVTETLRDPNKMYLAMVNTPYHLVVTDKIDANTTVNFNVTKQTAGSTTAPAPAPAPTPAPYSPPVSGPAPAPAPSVPFNASTTKAIQYGANDPNNIMGTPGIVFRDSSNGKTYTGQIYGPNDPSNTTGASVVRFDYYDNATRTIKTAQGILYGATDPNNPNPGQSNVVFLDPKNAGNNAVIQNNELISKDFNLTLNPNTTIGKETSGGLLIEFTDRFTGQKNYARKLAANDPDNPTGEEVYRYVDSKTKSVHFGKLYEANDPNNPNPGKRNVTFTNPDDPTDKAVYEIGTASPATYVPWLGTAPAPYAPTGGQQLPFNVSKTQAIQYGPNDANNPFKYSNNATGVLFRDDSNGKTYYGNIYGPNDPGNTTGATVVRFQNYDTTTKTTKVYEGILYGATDPNNPNPGQSNVVFLDPTNSGNDKMVKNTEIISKDFNLTMNPNMVVGKEKLLTGGTSQIEFIDWTTGGTKTYAYKIGANDPNNPLDVDAYRYVDSKTNSVHFGRLYEANDPNNPNPGKRNITFTNADDPTDKAVYEII